MVTLHPQNSSALFMCQERTFWAIKGASVLGRRCGGCSNYEGTKKNRKMKFLVTAAFAAFLQLSSVYCVVNAVDWCYHLPTCYDATWPVTVPKYCGGQRQSPINIVSSAATANRSLTAFSFKNFDSRFSLKSITNTGKTIKVSLGSGVKVSGGGLSEDYDGLHFHLHWGNGAAFPGSEHTVDQKRYPMELHIVNMKSSYNGNINKGLEDSTGLAVLGFFIEECQSPEKCKSKGWKKLTSYLKKIRHKGDSARIKTGISLDDLLEGVDRTQYYRYLGSLTTPSCNEAVVWTVFKEPILLSKALIDLFSHTVHIGDSTSPYITNVYRNVQKDLPVTTQP